MRTRLVFAVVALLFASLPLAIAADAGPEAWRLDIGTPADAEEQAQRQVVGGQVIASPPWMVGGFCGGTLIAPQWVISAHHCGDRTGATYTIGAVETRMVVQYIPFTNGEFNHTAADLALWKLDQPSSQTPLEMSRRNDLDDPGDWVYGIGYGNLAADVPNDGQLRSTGWMQVDKDLGWQFEYGEPGITTCFGDSGGPVIGDANPPNGQLILVGVTSYTVNNDQNISCTHLAGAAKVSDQVGWIDAVIAANGGPGEYEGELVINPIPAQANAVGDTVDVQPSGYQSLGQPVSWSATGLPPGVVIDSATGRITGSPTEAGEYTPVVVISSGRFGEIAQFTWTVTAPPGPSLDPIADRSDQANETVELQPVIVGADGETISWSASGLPPGVDFDTETGLVTGTPSEPGEYAVQVSAASDCCTAFATFTWTITAAPFTWGDANCDGVMTIVDALVVAQYSTDTRADSASCPLPDGSTHINAAPADINSDGTTDIVDALHIARCVSGIVSEFCTLPA